MRLIRLYHGTTAGAADALAREGSRPPDIDALVAAVATRFGVPEGDLRAVARYVTGAPRRLDFAVATHPAFARLYAGRRGGEAAHDLVTGATRLADPTLSAPEIERRARAELSEQGALVTLDIPFERARADLPTPRLRSAPWASYEEWAGHVTDGSSGRNITLSIRIQPEWIATVDLVEPVISEPGLGRWVPKEAWHILRSAKRPPSIGPGREGIYERSAVQEWLKEQGVSLAP
ncbi:MAG: hypothetical protein WD271_03265 [Acidimicrobiia bacterium]